MAVQLSGEGLTIEAIEQVARHNERLEYSQQGLVNLPGFGSAQNRVRSCSGGLFTVMLPGQVNR